MTVEDQSNQKGVSLTTYYKYFKTGGGYLLTIFVFTFFFAVEVGTMTCEHVINFNLISLTIGDCNNK